MKIAVMHDYFTQMGGAEKVAAELVGALPGASLVTTVALEDRLPEELKGLPIETSWMQSLPKMKEYYRLYFLLYPFAVRSMDLSDYDLVVSSSSGYAKGVRAGRDTTHICYCHTPMRWVWNFDSYSSRESFGKATRVLLPLLISALRRWDAAASRQPDHFIANSISVAERIRRAYGRASEVIHPPVDLSRFHLSQDQSDYYVVLSRLISYKRIDLAVTACSLLRRKLLVIGDGPDRARLESMAGPTVTFLGRASDRDVEQYVSRCRALLFPGEEDFGLAPLEVAAAGRPTVAYRAGGAIETIRENETGVFFKEQNHWSLIEAMQRLERQSWSQELLRSHAEGFGVDVFREKLVAFLDKVGVPLKTAQRRRELIPKPCEPAPAWFERALRRAR
jgi:glycosyltransferase involved in cell wall biosynthesis